MIKVELPNTDMLRVLRSQEELTEFLNSYGVSAVYDAEYKVYRVPAFSAGREAYIAAKIEDCKIYGCE